MAKKSIGYYSFIIIIGFLVFASNFLFSKTFLYPLPGIKASPISQYLVMDLTAAVTGLRRLGADVAWIQLLQYYATPEVPLDQETEYKLSIDMTKYLIGIPVKKDICYKGGCHDTGHYHPHIDGGKYYDLLNYCYRIINLDPFFFYVYLYGSGALAWNLDRPEEAIELLKKGIDNMEKYKVNITKDIHQPFWQLNLYMSAIIYRKMGENEKMIALLDTAAKQPEAPNMVKVILANIYQSAKKYDSALAQWTTVYDSKDPEYLDKSEKKIMELHALIEAK